MKSKIYLVIIVIVFLQLGAFGQDAKESTDRPRVIITDNLAVDKSAPKKVIVVGQNASKPRVQPTPPLAEATKPLQKISVVKPPTSLSYVEFQRQLENAKRQMRSKPLRISLLDAAQTTDVVRIAFYDSRTKRNDFLVIAKPIFLTRNSNTVVRSEAGQFVRIYTVRGNGVNTPVRIFDTRGRPLLPLIVQYPIEKYGTFREMAYYVSTHPGAVTPGAVGAGRQYVRNVIDIARQKLRAKGIYIAPKVADVAERLALVEHIDHSRFNTEHHPRIYDDVFALFAFNKGQTFRYSVSSAGAGGMVQMIPATYRMIRSRYYLVGLNTNFVTGMRDHTNAAQAMLLYMQMTWNDLRANTTIREAMEAGIATQEQLMAAGYNSNPARLPRYIARGAENWTQLIPRETRVYLRIFESVERWVPMRARKK